MKRIVYILLFLCCLPFGTTAQDLAPGQQSQGLLESKNVTVEHATGIFHYTIPLYTLKSGDYELPVSLKYTGKGVKVNDRPGLVGYNWTLDTGGIVTRTVRGGIPDEDINCGYLRFENDTVPLSGDATRVNRHKRDGECDIFTAVFGGKSVNFIIRKGDYGSLHAEPIERTDVRIECVHAGRLINGWTVTDSDGTRYAYMRKEWTKGLNKQDHISFNGISGLQYVSSWYLTSIEPVNGKTIELKYMGTDTDYPTETDRKVTRYSDTYRIKYEYGRPLEIPVFDFEPYRKRFEEYIDAALGAVQNYDLQLQVEGQFARFEAEIGWVKNPDYDFIAEQRMINHRVLGMPDLSLTSTVTEELLELIQSLAEEYRTTNYAAHFNFSMAYYTLLECVNGNVKELVTERELNGRTTYKVISPVLEAVQADEKILFRYYSTYDMLHCIGKETTQGKTVSAYRLLRGEYDNLETVVSLDRDSVPVGTVTMTYHPYPEGGRSMTDIYGYRKRYSSDADACYLPWPDIEYTQIHSLKEIHTADGGRIGLDYELNEVPTAYGEETYGGIRIKSIILGNPAQERSDTVSYHYGPSFFTFLKFPDNFEKDEYDGFTDWISYSRIRTQGHATLSPGNNGLYYPQVQERISGQGTRTYLSNFTDYAPDLSHSHWITGLPVFIIEQDEEGNVEHVLQNLYYTDVENGLAPCIFPECLVHLESASYDKTLPQMTANEKYMDLEDMRREMGVAQEVDLTESNARAFWLNIASRIKSSYDVISYSLHYGGATLLAERREYRPAGKEYTDFRQLMEEQQPCSRTVYHYDNLRKHTRPTRTVNYDSRGDSTVVHQVYAGDMAESASTDMADMQEANILSPVVKRATVKNGRLTEEEVTVYGTEAKGNGCFYMPEKVIVRSEGYGGYAPDTLSLCSGNTKEWQVRKKITSAVIGEDSYLPVEIIEPGKHTALIHDPDSRRCILRTKDVPANEILAADSHRYGQTTLADETTTVGRILFLAEKMQQGIEGYDPESILLDSYQEFRSTRWYERGKKMLEFLGKGTECVRTENEVEETLELLDTCATDLYMGIDDYIAWQMALEYSYFPAEGIPSPWNMTYEEMNELLVKLMEELHENGGTLIRGYLQSCNAIPDGALDFIPQSLTVPPGQQGYTLYLVPMKESVHVDYTVTHDGGTTKRTVKLSGMEPGILKAVAVNLSEYANVTGMTVTGFGALQFLALLPEGTEFEATSYNGDGTVAVKFDHDGKMLRHEYDSAGRPVRVRDENGKTLEESDYHVKNKTF